MALQALILELERKGLSATIELPNGKWCHSPEYTAARYRTREAKQPKPQQPTPEEKWFERAIGKLTPAERIQLTAMLSED